MTFKTALCVMVISIVAGPAAAGRIESGYVGCVTEDALDEFISASVAGDQRQVQALLGTLCAPIGGLEYSMVDRGILVSEIRVYIGSDSVRLFTVAEAAR